MSHDRYANAIARHAAEAWESAGGRVLDLDVVDGVLAPEAEEWLSHVVGICTPLVPIVVDALEATGRATRIDLPTEDRERLVLVLLDAEFVSHETDFDPTDEHVEDVDNDPPWGHGVDDEDETEKHVM